MDVVKYTCVYYIVDQRSDGKRLICIEASLAGIGRRLRRCTLSISLYIQRQRPSPTLSLLPYHSSHGSISCYLFAAFQSCLPNQYAVDDAKHVLIKIFHYARLIIRLW